MPETPDEQRSRNMRAIRSRDTGPELALAAAMRAVGLRYRKQARGLAGTPDFVFIGSRVAVFVDGDFWHGRQWPPPPGKFGAKREFWVAKIERTRTRDAATNVRLNAAGWLVLRFWATEVLADAAACAADVKQWVRARAPRRPHTVTPASPTLYVVDEADTAYWLAADEDVVYGAD